MIVWNEGDRIRRQLRQMSAFASTADIIVVDGGSTDGSLEHSFLAENLVTALVVTYERGLGTAVRLALAFALMQGYEGIITVDGNGKDGIEAVTEFAAALNEGWDLVQGSRFLVGGVHGNTPLDRLLAIRLLAAPLSKLSGFKYSDPTNGFRALSRRYLLDPRLQPIRPQFVHFNLQHYLIFEAPRLGFKVKEIPVKRIYPKHGPVPTKIDGIRDRWRVMSALLATVVGWYRPSSSK